MDQAILRPVQMPTSREYPLILVVEDTPAIQDMLSYVLKLQGYQPVCVANGQEALEWMDDAVRIGRFPMAILLDLLMPVMNGTTFLTRLRAHWSAPLPIPPIVLLTVQPGNYDHLACGAVLTKPFHIRDLCDRLRYLISLAYPKASEIASERSSEARPLISASEEARPYTPFEPFSARNGCCV